MPFKIDKPKRKTEPPGYAVPKGTRQRFEYLEANCELADSPMTAALLFRAILDYGERALTHHWQGAEKHLSNVEVEEGITYDPALRRALALMLALEHMDSLYRDPKRRPAPYRGDTPAQEENVENTGN